MSVTDPLASLLMSTGWYVCNSDPIFFTCWASSMSLTILHMIYEPQNGPRSCVPSEITFCKYVVGKASLGTHQWTRNHLYLWYCSCLGRHPPRPLWKGLSCSPPLFPWSIFHHVWWRAQWAMQALAVVPASTPANSITSIDKASNTAAIFPFISMLWKRDFARLSASKDSSVVSSRIVGIQERASAMKFCLPLMYIIFPSYWDINSIHLAWWQDNSFWCMKFSSILWSAYIVNGTLIRSECHHLRACMIRE